MTWTDEETDYALRLRMAKNSPAVIAERVGKTENAVSVRLSKLKRQCSLNYPELPGRNKYHCAKRAGAWVEQLEQGQTLRGIAQESGVPYKDVAHAVKKRTGVDRRYRRAA